MIRVRDDDILNHSSGHKDSFARFKKVHKIIVDGGALHVPAILVTEIQDFPEALHFIRAEREAGRMEVQWHGMSHVDYGLKTSSEIQEDIIKSQIFFRDNFGAEFTKFYTPWGADQAHIREACEMHSIEMVDCSKIVECGHISRDPEKYRGKDVEILIHWWAGAGRLERALKDLRG